MRPHILVLLFLQLIVLFVTPTFAEESEEAKDSSILTLDRIYVDGEFGSKGYSGRWLPDASAYIKLEKGDIVRHDAKTGVTEVMVSSAELTPKGESSSLSIQDYTFSDDLSLVLIYTNSKRVWRNNTRGDYWVLDRTARQLRKLGGDGLPSTMMFAKLSPSGSHVAYVRDKNIYVEYLNSHSIKVLTCRDSETIINGTFDWVYEEELGLQDGFRWSPDGKSIAYWQLDTEGVREVPLVNNTDSLYPKITWIPYPKVGQQNSSCRVGVVTIESAETQWIDVEGDPRNHYIARMEWAENSDELLVQQLNRRQDTNRVMLADAHKGGTKTILEDKDVAWVDIHDEMIWLDGGKQFTWVSEKDGWRHVYIVSRSGKKMTLATPGDFDVTSLLSVDEEAGKLYFIASPDNPTQRYLYRVGLNGKNLERLTPLAKERGTHGYSMSADSRWAIYSSSAFEDVPQTELISLPDHKVVRVFEDNEKLREKFAALDTTPSEFLRIDIGDDILLDAWMIKPPNFDPNKKYPLLIYVYGEPWGQTVLDRWGGTSYLWHLMMAQRGYLVMSIDNRGTAAPRGREWRKQVYGKVGVMAPKDQAAALQALVKERSYVDADRIGIWGWSGGGSMTLNMMFKYPEMYHTGIAVAPVPNMRYYDTIYQERYMGLPKDNVEGFYEGAPINYAKQLEGDLLLVHGTGDDNCHYSTMEMLINELILHNKPFSMMAYPNRSHGISEGKNTTIHLRTLMTQYFMDNLPANEDAGN